MVVTKVKSGSWEAKISYRDDNNKVQSERKRFKLKREAIEYESEFKRKLNEVENQKLTYKEIFEANIRNNESKVLARSIQEKRTNAMMYWPHLFDRKYTSITKKDWLDVWNNICSTDKSYATKNKAIKYMKSVGKFAYKFYDLPDNTKHLEVLQPNSDDIEEIVTWDQEEFNYFISCVDQYEYRALFTFYYDTGVTLSEALAIKKSDIKGNVVSITDLLENKTTHKRLKNRYRKRNVTLASKTLDIIEPLLKTEGNYVFGGIEPLSNRTVPRYLDLYIERMNDLRLKEELDPLPRITIHGFRHSHATNLINNNVNIVSVSRRLGHSNIQTTLNTYTHLLRDKDTELLNVIDEL